ncbi:hypothetical protein [Amycolatopsis sp. NPDC052450]|uniref:hypothetical protein n=1 Tax=Amycolatopsis sp. NPDC052450 TaxID=3363937 RepID=UPI0037C7F455
MAGISRRVALTGFASLGAATFVATDPTASAAASGMAPDCGPELITVTAPALYPEGTAWDPYRHAFLVGSATQGTVSVVGLDGTVRPLVPSLGLVSTLGMEVDRSRKRLYVAYSDYWVRRFVPVTQPPTSGVAVINLVTGRVVRKIDTALGRADTFANDVTVDHATGSVYVTDCVSATVQVIDRHGNVRALVTDPRFRSPDIGLNGIAWHPDGYLLTARYDTGSLFRISLDGRPETSVVATKAPLRGVEGFTLRPDGTLLAARNNLGAPGVVDAVVGLGSADGWRTARLVDQAGPWPLRAPTAVAYGPTGTYALSGQMDKLLTGGMTETTFWLRRVPF